MEQEHLFGLAFAKSQIKNWKKSYFRKNSKKPAAIMLRVWFAPEEQIFWKYYIECHVDGKIVSQNRIMPEAYDAMNSDPKLPRTHYTGVEFTILHRINQ